MLLKAYTVVGPGALSYANPGVLEGVAERRIKYGWGLEDHIDIGQYDVLVATENCEHIGKSGWLVVNRQIKTTIVVDCQNRTEKPRMSEVGLLADVNDWELVYEEGLLFLR